MHKSHTDTIISDTSKKCKILRCPWKKTGNNSADPRLIYSCSRYAMSIRWEPLVCIKNSSHATCKIRWKACYSGQNNYIDNERKQVCTYGQTKNVGTTRYFLLHISMISAVLQFYSRWVLDIRNCKLKKYFRVTRFQALI